MDMMTIDIAKLIRQIAVELHGETSCNGGCQGCTA